MFTKKRIAVLIPCYNEAQTVQDVVCSFKQRLPEAEIYVYDNNSTDDTARLAKEAGAIVRHEYRQGKGNVVRSMFRDIEADCYLIVDGDNTYPAEAAAEMCNLILEKKVDMVIGDRRFPILSKGFEIETEMTIHALDNNLLIYSIPIQYKDRPQGSHSKLDTYRDGARVLLTIFNLFRDYKPLRFFGVFSLLLGAISIVLFIPVFLEFLKTGMVPRFPTLIVSVVMMLGAFLSFVCGLILDTHAKSNRKNFEVQLNIIKLLLKDKGL